MVLTRGKGTKSVSKPKVGNANKGKKSGSTSASPFDSLLADEEIDSPCKVCSKGVGEDKGVKCDRCTAWVHLDCSGLEASEFGLLAKIQTLSVKWNCPVCMKELEKLPDPNDKMAAHDAKMDTMMEIVKVLQQQNTMILQHLLKQGEKMEEKVEHYVRETFEEDREKEARKNNLIVYNLKESEKENETAAEREDFEETFKVFCEVDGALTDYVLGERVEKVTRLGRKPALGGKPRPVKVVFKDNDTKMRILRKSKNLKKSESFKSVGISTDKTMKERAHDKKLVEERNKRREDGQDVVIFRGEVITREELEEKLNGNKNGASGNTAAGGH